MSGVGWIKLHRKIRDSSIFNDPALFRLAIICLTEAYHKETDQPIGNQIIKIMPGQFETGRFDLSDMYNSGLRPKERVSEKTVWRWLKKLENIEFLSIKTTNKFSIVTITNWAEYQKSDQVNGQQMTNKSPTDGQQMTTNKNVKNDKNEKNDKNKDKKPLKKISAGPDNPFNTYFLAFGNPSPFVLDDINFYLDAGVEEKAISYAIEKAAKNGSKFGYAKGILDNWMKDGTLTFEGVLAEEEAFQKRREERIHERRPAGNRTNPKPIVKGSDREQFDWNRKSL